jgi:hypothetical protein
MSNELKALLSTVIKRFLRAFVAGSLASIAAIVASAQLNPAVLKEPETFIYSLLLGALSGGIQALDKLYRYKEDSI